MSSHQRVDRFAGAVPLAVILAAIMARTLGAESASAAALNTVLATVAVAVMPGVVVLRLMRPLAPLTLLEVLGFGAACSFGLVHIVTVAAVLFHWSAQTSLAIVLGGSAAGAVILTARRHTGRISASRGELLVLTLLGVLAVYLYVQGSPFDSFEDQVHAALARRLSALDAPRLGNLYFAPGIVYTYPFPSTHYLVGLIALLSDVDALFVYHKLRFFWGTAAHLMVFLAARAMFGSVAVAITTTVTAVTLTFAGAFSMVSGFPWGWGQLTPYSHASDIAMNVLLPALMATAFSYLRADDNRQRAFLLGTSILLVFMLTVVHVREVVQFTAYMGCALVVTLLVPRYAPERRRAALLLGLAIGITGVYVLWQQNTASLVAQIAAEERREVIDVASKVPFRALLTTLPSELLPNYLLSFDQIFGGIVPFLLFAGPLVIVVFRREPLVWMMSASIAAYLLVMSIPLLAVAYIYVTYFEILFTPVRNVVFFMYLIAGGLVWITARAVALAPRRTLLAVPIGAGAGLLALLATMTSNHDTVGFFLPLVAAYGLTFLFFPRNHSFSGPGRFARAAAGVVVALAVIALWPDRSPLAPSATVNVQWRSQVDDADRQSLERQFSLFDGRTTPDYSATTKVYVYRLGDLSSDNVRRLVQHPSVEDTHRIDRSTFHVEQAPPPADDSFLSVERIAWLQYPGRILMATAAIGLALLGLALPLWVGTRGVMAPSAPGPATGTAWPMAAAVVLALGAFAIWIVRPSLSPLTLAPMPPVGHVHTPRDLFGALKCVKTSDMPLSFTEDILGDEGLTPPVAEACPPDYDLSRWAQANIPADAVLAINLWNSHFPAMFVPQQIVVFPPVERSFIHEKELFSAYYGFFDDRVTRYRVQPFFNSRESTVERQAFIDRLGVTHVLVDPPYYDEMTRVLGETPQRFERVYDANRWAIYAIRDPVRGEL